ncbi:MAG: T9SS type A sorting domain-containing protein, partial [Candidatus Kapaibacteriota bacterium]
RAFSVRLSGANIFRTVRAFLGDLSARVTVPSSTEAIVEVPASVNDIGGTSLVLRLQNSDGSSTEATLRIDHRPPPTIMGVTLQSGGRLQVRGVNFLAGIRSALGSSPITLVSQDGDTQFTAQIPPSFRLTANSPTVSLTVQNSDGRSHGVLLPRSMFEADMTTSSANGANTERTWENSSPTLELAEVVAGKQSQSGLQELSVYPNPVEGELRIGGVGVRTVRVYDMRGGVVLEDPTASGVVNVAALSAGAYMVVVEAADGRVARQRVVKR